MRQRNWAGALLVLLIVSGGVQRLHAQHETAADVADGARAFQSFCANCHGPDGNAIAGVDLGSGQFRRASTDADLVRIIRDGIPQAAMPPTNMSEEQAARIVAYLRSLAASKRTGTVTGDPGRGRQIVEGEGGCLACHRIEGSGSRVGPDLSAVGRARRAAELERALLDPDAEVLPANRFYRVVSRGGVTTTGRLLNIDTFSVQLLDTQEQLRSFMKSDLREHGFLPSPMPSYRGKLPAQAIADVVSYLATLKGR